jgi:hypothetical protein
VAVRHALGAPLRPLVVTNIYNDPVVAKMNEFGVAEHADIVYLHGYCDGNGLQASR